MAEELGSKSSSPATAINSSNIGFQLLKKHGWKEGTGLGISEQGRLEPVQTYVKNNKRGLGAQKLKKTKTSSHGHKEHSTKSKPVSKKQRKMQELEKRLQEKEFERAFYRDFWPDNV
ncbi:G patch domain and ankyrin repeat-containing protein 1 homolog [Ricinus communis]|uniref:G patch domain and ankyrin repeat-containing protein 1 homolog n=1 Tax=Ricinus communis TaxID=3988 RepID=UPI0007722E61|nr:G patch domain and ankyrin repeat-containing protein 1 homolog [Ricinus communis]|eukprot:XP_015570804.1 G patch domain and ankyrin repeat-containing protein 1 homolog [Ricinus communis]